MFFFLFGWGPYAKDLGPGQQLTCRRCHNHTTTRRLRTAMQITVFFVPVVRWRRRVVETCPICGHEHDAAALHEAPRNDRRLHVA